MDPSAAACPPPEVTSLTASLAAVPPAAVPAIIDCILASSALSSSLLFHALLDSFPSPSNSIQSNRIVSHTSALCHLIKNPDAPTDALRLFIRRSLVPLLSSIKPSNSELLNQVVELVCDVVSKTCSWELMGETLVPYFLRPLGVRLGMTQNEESSSYKWSSKGLAVEGLPLATSCLVLTSLSNSALSCGKESRSSGDFAAKLIWDLANLSLRFLAQSTENRAHCVRLLLPFIFSSLDALESVSVLVHDSPRTLSRVWFSKKLWEVCMYLFSLKHIDRLDGYNIISLYSSSLYSVKDRGNVSPDVNSAEFDLCAQKEFWEEIRRGLVDMDAFVRKQALYTLKASLSHSFSSNGGVYNECLHIDSESIRPSCTDQKISEDNTLHHVATTKRGNWADKEAKSLGVGKVCHTADHSLSTRERWNVFLLLYEMLDEYGTHLVQAAWSHQVSLLLQPTPSVGYLNSSSPGIYQAQVEISDGIFKWPAVLWERGFFHENPQVRCLIMQSFLDIDWGKCGNCAQEVPASFVLGPFILALNDVVYHKEFGVKGVYTSRSIQGATHFLYEYSRLFSLSKCAAFVWSLASIARQEAFGRAGLMALACCIASAACPSSSRNVSQLQGWNSDAEESVVDKLSLPEIADLLDVLGTVIEKSKQHFNPNYRLQVCQQILKAVFSLINVCAVPCNLLLHFLSTVPREFTDGNGLLRGSVHCWLTQSNNGCFSCYSANFGATVLDNLINFPSSFIKYTPNFSISFDDEDVSAWLVEAERWARVLFLVISEENQLQPVFMLLLNATDILCKQNDSMDYISVKVLILVLSLVEELQVGSRKVTSCRSCLEAGTTKSAKDACIACRKYIDPFLHILEKLVQLAKFVSPIFWSASMINNTQLSCSITGKLGGPSQRRLDSHLTSAMLEAIVSIRAVSRISSWCSEIKKGDFVNSSFTFLWDFCWEVIKSLKPNSETGAEVLLAAYEALASVMKALSTCIPLAFDFIRTYNKSILHSEDDVPLLDPLLLNFLSNVNALLDTGSMKRSRRAVLMNWKWICLDSLLSIPNIVNGVNLRSTYAIFSDSAIRVTFLDIVESLENAGEMSVLPMLRSVRFLIELLCSNARNPSISSNAGVNSQMMLQLVHSSWVLHLSCNKRRVAPIAALISAVLHQSVFGDLSMHETIGNNQGPLKWFIENLLVEGIRSPRTIRLASLHLSGLWISYPQTIKFYLQELKLLSLYGSVAFDEDFEAELSENHEARTEVSLLAQCPDNELTEVFISTEMYARVSVAVLFYKLAKLANRTEGHKTKDSFAALHCGKLFLLELLDAAVNDKDISKELYKKYSAVHRRKVRAWQMICILSHYVEEDIVDEVTSNLHICLCNFLGHMKSEVEMTQLPHLLSQYFDRTLARGVIDYDLRNNLPAVRQFLEMFAVQVYLKFPILAEKQLIPVFYNYTMRPQALSSYVFIATNVIVHTTELPVQIKHLYELLPPIIPFLTSHHHNLRGFTQLLVHYVLCKLWPALRPISSETAPFEKKCFDDIKSYLEENVDCVKLRASMEGLLGAFDPRTSATPAGIFNTTNEGSEFECVPVSLMELVTAFLNDARDDLRYSMAKDAAAINNEFLMVADACKDTLEERSTNAEKTSPVTIKDLSLDFQKKITSHKCRSSTSICDGDYSPDNAEQTRMLLDMEKEDQLISTVLQSRMQAMEMIRGTTQQFILVASFIDRIPNLAGLARTCEVFKATGLVIADANIVHDKQFQLISVTADKWVPIIEVPVSSMKVFLQKKRREGFSIIGLEQTANSIPLDQYSFASKTVLVLGQEKEGIAVDIIHVLDACVEIPQLGIIRSLNVHVSGAIALWEYTRQMRLK